MGKRTTYKKNRSLTFRTGAWMEERDIILSFDSSWDVREYTLPVRPVLTDRDIRHTLQHPVASSRISDLAAGKKQVVLIVDDISRPTPANRILPFVLEELEMAGIPDERIRLVIAVGAHRPLSEKEMCLKFGADILRRFAIRNHDFAGQSLKFTGVSSHGIPILLDEWVARADLKIGIGSIIPHDAAGFSGGGKLIVPGVSGFPTLLSLHALFEKRGRGVLDRPADRLDFRTCIEQIARQAGLDFVVNCVVQSERKLAGLFAGDMIQAYQNGAEFARSLYAFKISRDLAEQTDIVLINSYPLDVDPDQLLKAAAPAVAFPNAQVVLINAALDENMYRGINVKSKSLAGKKGYRAGRTFLPISSSPRKRMIREMIRKSRIVPLATRIPPVYRRLRDMQRNYTAFTEECERRDKIWHGSRRGAIMSRDDLIVISPSLCEADFYRRFPDGLLFRTWDKARTALKDFHKNPGVVALHSGTLQIPVIE